MHHFVKEKQSAAFKSDLDLSDTNFDTAVLQIDFAENYSTFYQDEVQLAHWAKTQITIFTAALWQKNECHPAAVVSDDVLHCKQCILVFVRKILQSLLMDSVKTVHIWSDGPSSQFKNWYITAALPWLQVESDIQIDWNLCAASHGKGTVDGIGGTIKRLAGRRVVTGKSIITDSVSFFTKVKSTFSTCQQLK